MFDELKHLLKHTSVYGAGNILGKLVGFIMIPFYTHYLTTADYGTLELLDLTLMLTGLALLVWMNASVVRHYYDYDDEKNRNEVISTVLIASFLIGAVIAAGGFIFARPLSSLILKNPALHQYITLVGLSFFFSCVSAVSLSHLRARQCSALVVSMDLINLIVTLSLNIYLIAFRQMGVVAVLYSGLVGNVLIATILTVNTVRHMALSFSWEKLKFVAAFGAPLLFSSIAAFAVNFSDRFFLRHFNSLSDVGIYALGYKFGFMLTFLVVQPFNMIWGARMYEIAKSEDAANTFSRICTYYSLVLVTVALGLSVIIKEVIAIISAQEFHSAYKVVPIVALAYVFEGLNRYFVTGLYIAKKTIYLTYIGVVSVAINLGLNYVLIGHFGMLGAAWATAISFCAMAALAYFAAQKAYPIPYSFIRVAAALAVASAVYAGSRLVATPFMVLTVGIKLGLFACFPLGLYLVGFFEKQEMEKARQIAHAFFARYRWRTAVAAGE